MRRSDHEGNRLQEWQNKCLNEHGWYMHYVPDDTSSPYSVNIHTHGLLKNFNHPDIQICMPLSKKVVQSIFIGVIIKIKAGELTIEKDKYYDGVLGGGYKVKYIDAIETNRSVLRMILPDKAGHLEYLDMDPEYQGQYTKLDNRDET